MCFIDREVEEGREWEKEGQIEEGIERIIWRWIEEREGIEWQRASSFSIQIPLQISNWIWKNAEYESEQDQFRNQAEAKNLILLSH